MKTHFRPLKFSRDQFANKWQWRRHCKVVERLARQNCCTIVQARPPVPKDFTAAFEWFRTHVATEWPSGSYPTLSLTPLGEHVYEIVPDYAKTTKENVRRCLPLLLKQFGATRYFLVMEAWIFEQPLGNSPKQKRGELLVVIAVDKSGEKMSATFEIIRSADGRKSLLERSTGEISSPWTELFALPSDSLSRDTDKMCSGPPKDFTIRLLRNLRTCSWNTPSSTTLNCSMLSLSRL